MLAPDPALARLLPAPATATNTAPLAPGGGRSATGGAAPEVGAAAPAFELLADAAAVLADADGKVVRIAVPRGKSAPADRKPAPVDPALVAVAPVVLPLPAAPAAAAPLEVAPVATPVEAAAAPEVAPAGVPSAGAPAVPPSVAEPEAERLPVDEIPSPEAPTGSKLSGGIRAAEAGVVPALRPEVPAPPPLAEAGSTGWAGPLPAALAAGWQLVLPVAASAEVGKAAAPVAPEAVLGQVAVAVARSGGAARKVELRLDPPELGRVEIHLAPTERGALHATVVAERAETHELLRRHGDVLARELGAAGYSEVTLSFSSGGEAAGQNRLARAPEPGGAGFVLAAEDGSPVPAASPRPVAPADGGLDIRL